MSDNGLFDKVKGTVKETVGKVTGNEELQGEGLLDKAVGKVKEVAGDVTEKVKDTFNK